MTWKPSTFGEACKRAAGRRAYNKKRRRARERRISALIASRFWRSEVTARELAAALGVHESTVSRDLKFIRRIRREWGRMMGGFVGFGEVEMSARSFRFLPRGRGYELSYHYEDGVRRR